MVCPKIIQRILFLITLIWKDEEFIALLQDWPFAKIELPKNTFYEI